MEPESTAARPADGPELSIHLDLEGLAALLATIQEAMENGRAQLPNDVRGIAARGEGAGRYPNVTVTFQQPGGGDRDEIPVRAAPTRLLEPAD